MCTGWGTHPGACFRSKLPRVYRSLKLTLHASQVKRENFYSPLDGMLVHRRVTPSVEFSGTHLYTWMERGTVRVKGLAQEHSTMSPARARTQTGVECTNQEARAPLLAHARPVLWQNFQLLYFSSRGFTSVCLCQMVTLISLHEASYALMLNSEKLDHENRPTAKARKAT